MPIRRDLSDIAYDVLSLLERLDGNSYQSAASLASTIDCPVYSIYLAVALLRDMGHPIVTYKNRGYFQARTAADYQMGYKGRSALAHTVMRRTINGLIETYADRYGGQDRAYIKAKANRVLAYLLDFVRNGEASRAEDHGLVVREWGNGTG